MLEALKIVKSVKFFKIKDLTKTFLGFDQKIFAVGFGIWQTFENLPRGCLGGGGR